jgi:3-methyladenine DNA glycosylase AlkD
MREKPMNPHHRALLDSLKEHALPNAPAPTENDSYFSSGHPYLRVPVPKRRLVAREWLRANKALALADVVATIDSLFSGETHEEKTLASILLGDHPPARRAVELKQIDGWLDHLHGWAEVDHLCQNVFTAPELMATWDEWRAFLIKLRQDPSIDKRRASVVFLVGPVRNTSDDRLATLAFENIDRLQHEREIMITKALSWLLRCLTTHHADQVAAFVAANESTLPRIAVRETATKLRTGTKRGFVADQ